MTAPVPFTVGIEEEYLLVDRETRDLIHTAPKSLLEGCAAEFGQQITTEFLQCQVEVGTKVCRTVAEAGDDLRRLRGAVARHAAAEGLGLVAASTHPFAQPGTQTVTEKERYRALEQDLQGVVRRLMICGMHVHVCIPDPDLRIDLMGQVAYFLPHILALTTSSPFWRGEDTGLASYRLSVFDNLPRTGLPEKFDSWGEYERHVRVLVNTGVIEDASKIWWDVRPSARYPTLEMRICDVATRLDDALAAAALLQAVLRMLWRLRRSNQRWRSYANMLVQENRWRAQRYGLDEGMIDFGKSEMQPYADLLDEIIQLTAEDAEALGSTAEIGHARAIVERGTSAHHQRRVYESARADGADRRTALNAVVDELIAASAEGVPA